jgi:carbonic anhydrase/acetyltransferase-like protein (isoleucine patch superfamily)
MGNVLPVNGLLPEIGMGCLIALNSTISGDVVLGVNCSVWFNAVIRGDVNPIRIGNQTNIQDHAVIHGSFGGPETFIGSNVTIGHRAIIHGCKVENNVLIGMGSILLDNCVVGSGCIVGAGSLVLENTILESGFLYAGSPVRKIKQVTPEQVETIQRTAIRYPQIASWYDSNQFIRT